VTQEPSLRRTLALLGGTAAVVAALLAAMQVDASRKSSRAAAQGSRLAVQIVEETTSSGLRLNLLAAAFREREALLQHAMALEASAGRSGLAPVASADGQAALQLDRALASMLGEPIAPAAFLDEQDVLRNRADPMVERQRAALARSERYGRRSSAAARGLLLVATAGALLTLAGSLVGRRPAHVAVGTAALVLCGAVATGALGLVT
jgi:hypothetical protein